MSDRLERYQAVVPATKPPHLPLSAQMVVFAEMAAPEIRGAAHMIGTEWQAEALRLEGAVDRAEKWERLARRLYALMGEEGERLLPGDLESSELLRDGGQSS